LRGSGASRADGVALPHCALAGFATQRHSNGFAGHLARSLWIVQYYVGEFGMDSTGIRSSAFVRTHDVVRVSLIRMYRTEVRGAELMGTKAKQFRRHG
jgi:hypothetical protein